MGYRAEKEKIEKQTRLFKRIFIGILIFLILGLCIVSFFVPMGSWKYYVSLPDVSKRQEGELRIHYIDVGQGDATLIEFPDGKVMLIDGGDGSGDATKSLLRYLNALKIKEIDALLLTHADGDHCGGLAAVLKHKTVFNAYLPPSFPENDTEYGEFYTAVVKEKCNYSYTSPFSDLLDNEDSESKYPYVIKALYPHSKMVENVLTGEIVISDDNEVSAVIWLGYMGVGALFMGDAPQSVEAQIVLDDQVGANEGTGVFLKNTQILKLSHHGSKTATSASFLQYVNAKEGIVSCGENNLYGHPADETLLRLEQANVNLHRTDRDGHIMVTVSKNGGYEVEYI